MFSFFSVYHAVFRDATRKQKMEQKAKIRSFLKRIPWYGRLYMDGVLKNKRWKEAT